MDPTSLYLTASLSACLAQRTIMFGIIRPSTCIFSIYDLPVSRKNALIKRGYPASLTMLARDNKVRLAKSYMLSGRCSTCNSCCRTRGVSCSFSQGIWTRDRSLVNTETQASRAFLFQRKDGAPWLFHFCWDWRKSTHSCPYESVIRQTLFANCWHLLLVLKCTSSSVKLQHTSLFSFLLYFLVDIRPEL